MDNVILKSKDVTLLEVLDRVLDKGVVISGDIVISLADVDLIYLGLRLLLSSVETMEELKQCQSEFTPFYSPLSRGDTGGLGNSLKSGRGLADEII